MDQHQNEVGVLVFGPAAHRYTLDGVELPSVTKIIGSCGFYEFPFVSLEQLAAKAQLGRDVHSACELFDNGTLDWSTLTDEVLYHFEGWVKFRADHPELEIIANEEQLFHPHLKYAGTLDRVLGSDRHGLSVRRTVADIKIGMELPAAKMQTAAYLNAYNATRQPREQATIRISIHLPGAGKYKLVQHAGVDDFRAFTACLQLFKWRNENV